VTTEELEETSEQRDQRVRLVFFDRPRGSSNPPRRAHRIRRWRRAGTEPADRDDATSSSAWWTVVGVTLLVWASQLFGYVNLYPLVSLAVVAVGMWGLATVGATWLPVRTSRRTRCALAWATVGFIVGAFVLWSFLQIATAPSYGTDEIAFDQYAAQLLVHGSNPYVHSMAPAFAVFHVSPNEYTFRLDGQPVTTLSYPALSFLLYAPLIALGWSSQAAVAVNVLAWSLAIVIGFALLPRRIRPLALVVGSLSVYIGFAVGGVTDALFVPFLLGAVWSWDRFPERSARSSWVSPVLLGLAMAVKQTPWLLLPFLVAGIWLETRRSRSGLPGFVTAGRYLAISLVAFAVPNLAFIVLSPHAWASGVLTPLIGHAVPAGQGVVGLSLFLGIGGGSLTAFAVALMVVYVALFALFVTTYPWLKRCVVLLPAIVLFFSARSFGSYLVTLLPVATVAAFTTRSSGGAEVVTTAAPDGAAVSPQDAVGTTGVDTSATTGSAGEGPGPWRHWRWVAGAGAAAVALALAAVFLFSPPLSVRIVSVETTGQLATVVRIGVQVTNNSSNALRPAFTVGTSGSVSSFWTAKNGPSVLRSHQSASYTLVAPNYFAQPSISQAFQVMAFTNAPGTVSRSASYLPTVLHVALVPDSVNRSIGIAQSVTFQAQVLNQFNQAVRVAGRPVYMGQVTYAQRGLIFSEAVINNSQVGQTPVMALTDRSGIATFTVRDAMPSADPVYFEANLVNSNDKFPYGYSEIVPVTFVNAP
jgi:hypothetical protein